MPLEAPMKKEETDVPAPVPGKGRKKSVDVLSARTGVYASQTKELKALVGNMVQATQKASEAFVAGTAVLNRGADACMLNYLQVVTLRRMMLRYWHLRQVTGWGKHRY